MFPGREGAARQAWESCKIVSVGVVLTGLGSMDATGLST